MIGLMYDRSLLSQKFFFEGLKTVLPSVGYQAEDFIPYKDYTHILAHVDSLDQTALDKHRELGSKIILYTPRKAKVVGTDMVISTHEQSPHLCVSMGVVYRKPVERKPFSKVYWLGDKTEAELLEKMTTAEESILPFEVVSLNNPEHFKGKKVKFYNDTIFDDGAIFLTSNVNEYVMLECYVRGIPCIAYEYGKKDLFGEIQDFMPEELKRICTNTSLKNLPAMCDLIAGAPGIYRPISETMRSHIVKNYLLNATITDIAELL